MKRFLAVSIAAVLVFGAGAIKAEDKDRASKSEHVLILAKPSRVRLIGPVDPSAAGGYTNASVFEVRFTDIEVVAGTFADTSLVVNLTGTHAGVFRRGRDIYMLLDIHGGDAKVLYWGDPYRVACVPKDLVGDALIAAEFEIAEPSGSRERERVCAVVGIDQ